MTEHVVVTGAAGQDGSLLCEQLRARGHTVVPVTRAGARMPDGALVPVTLTHRDSVERLFERIHPSRCFHLAGCSAPSAFDDADEGFTIGSTRALLDVITAGHRDCRFFLAASSALFGEPAEAPQRETTPFAPATRYGRAKLEAHGLVVAAREAGAFAASGVLYNHESVRRDERFVTRKISVGVARIARGLQQELVLGTLDAQRDWGDAAEYVVAMALMLEAREPRDLILASGRLHTVGDLVDVAFRTAGVPPKVRLDRALVHPERGAPLLGDPSQARDSLGWQARRPIEDVIREMVETDLALLPARSTP